MRQGDTSLRYILLLCIATASVVAMSFRPVQGKGKLTIRFENYVGDKRLVLDTVSYKNELGQSFTVTNFKYYVSNISLTGKDGKEYHAKDSYFLIMQDDESTWSATLDDVPADTYQSMSFMIGVDSFHNCNGAQSGALDPVNGMFWTWNTGYIFLKLEGKSPDSKSPGGMFEYHIGGYKAPNNFIRNVSLPFHLEPLHIAAGKASTIAIKTDASEVLKHPNTIDFARLSSVTDFHHGAEIADNYMDIFSVMHISYEK